MKLLEGDLFLFLIVLINLISIKIDPGLNHFGKSIKNALNRFLAFYSRLTLPYLRPLLLDIRKTFFRAAIDLYT